MGSPSDFIQAFSTQLESHREHGNISGMIDTLRNLAVMEVYNRRVSVGLTHLDEAEQLLHDLDEKGLEQICNELRTSNLEVAHDFVRTRRLMLATIREKLQQKQ